MLPSGGNTSFDFILLSTMATNSSRQHRGYGVDWETIAYRGGFAVVDTRGSIGTNVLALLSLFLRPKPSNDAVRDCIVARARVGLVGVAREIALVE